MREIHKHLLLRFAEEHCEKHHCIKCDYYDQCKGSISDMAEKIEEDGYSLTNKY